MDNMKVRLEQWDGIWLDANLATMAPGNSQAYGAIEDGALAVKDNRICWLGLRRDLPGEIPTDIPIYRCDGRWITPGLIDCHTHLVYGGDRGNSGHHGHRSRPLLPRPGDCSQDVRPCECRTRGA